MRADKWQKTARYAFHIAISRRYCLHRVLLGKDAGEVSVRKALICLFHKAQIRRIEVNSHGDMTGAGRQASRRYVPAQQIGLQYYLNVYGSAPSEIAAMRRLR